MSIKVHPNRKVIKGTTLSHLWKSPWTSWIGLRYLRSKKNTKFLSFITVLSILGIGIGVMAMIVVLSVMDGFEAELKKRLMSTDLHVLITPKPKEGVSFNGYVPQTALSETKAESFLKSDPRVEAFWPVVASEAILRFEKKVTGVVLKGVQKERLSRLDEQIVERAQKNVLIQNRDGKTYRLPSVFIGQELAFNLGLIPGDTVIFISPTETVGPLGAAPRTKKFVIEGIYRSGFIEQELHSVFTKAKSVHSFLRKRDVVSQWEVVAKEFDQAQGIADGLRTRLSSESFRVRDWMELNSNLFASLKLERLAMFVILAFIVIVASFNIVTTLTLMVLEKKKEIAILKTIGARHAQVASIFLAEGLMIGGVGVGGGVVLGWVLCLLLKRYEFITLPDIYYDRTLPVSFEPFYYALVAIAAVLIVLSACLYPSRRAARMAPLEGMRG